MYKNILGTEIAEYNTRYKRMNREHPSFSILEKQQYTLGEMARARGFGEGNLDITAEFDPRTDGRRYQYKIEVLATEVEVLFGGVERFYIKDESLFDFFKQTEVRQKEVDSIVNSDLLKSIKNGISVYGLIGKEQAYTIVITDYVQSSHLLSLLTDDMNYTFNIEHYGLEHQTENAWVFNLAINFLFYINAFPECVVDGVPSGVKRNPRAKVISTSEKIVSHTTVEHGFVRPHFRSGYFRHYNSDFYVNCKGQVRFIASTMVKGKAKTVLQKEENV